jgi:putative pyruvate formate lyase activating enzyme
VALGADELHRRATALRELGAPCRWCPRQCGANRLGGELGQCGAGSGVVISSVGLHFGEEEHFVGRGGSGTVFFACCNLRCVFCQNWEISHAREGQLAGTEELAAAFLALQEQGAENLNLVTPSHYPASILAALAQAVGQGFSLPVVWNSSGYDSVEALRFFEGVVDVYMPDFKFASDELGAKLTQASDYATTAHLALSEMVRQVGAGLLLADGIAQHGMSVRHLVMPGLNDDSRACLDFLRTLGPEITVNIMRQYRPAFQAHAVPGLNRHVTRDEFNGVVAYALSLGLRNTLAQ